MAEGLSMWPELAEWLAARFGYAVAGTIVYCAATGCGDKPAIAAPPPMPPPISRPAPRNSREIEIAADSYHQCYATAWIEGPNGRARRYSSLLDSGAAGKIVINRQQAAQLGFNIAGLSFDQEVETANGTGRAANIELAQFRLGGYRITNVDAVVDYNGMGSPLIGAEILKTLNYRMGETSCTLTLPGAAASVRSASIGHSIQRAAAVDDAPDSGQAVAPHEPTDEEIGRHLHEFYCLQSRRQGTRGIGC